MDGATFGTAMEMSMEMSWDPTGSGYGASGTDYWNPDHTPGPYTRMDEAEQVRVLIISFRPLYRVVAASKNPGSQTQKEAFPPRSGNGGEGGGGRGEEAGGAPPRRAAAR
jgi:hypothetical protein